MLTGSPLAHMNKKALLTAVCVALFFVRLAQYYLQARDKRRAIDALKRAVKQGFSDLKLIEASSEFDVLRDDGDFKKVLEEIRAKGQAAR